MECDIQGNFGRGEFECNYAMEANYLGEYLMVKMLLAKLLSELSVKKLYLGEDSSQRFCRVDEVHYRRWIVFAILYLFQFLVCKEIYIIKQA